MVDIIYFTFYNVLVPTSLSRDKGAYGTVATPDFCKKKGFADMERIDRFHHRPNAIFFRCDVADLAYQHPAKEIAA